MPRANILSVPEIRLPGRFHQESARREKALPLFWAGSGIELCFTGEELTLHLEADFLRAEPWIAVEINGAPLLRMPLPQGRSQVCLFRGMTDGSVKRVRLFKETQPVADDPAHSLLIREVSWKGGVFVPPPEPSCMLEFIGDSLTSGEGVVGAVGETDWAPVLFSASRTWAKRTADILHGEFTAISQSGWGVRSGWDNNPDHRVPDLYGQVCAPAAGEMGLRMGAQEAYRYGPPLPDAVIVNLGTNDAGAMDNPPWYGKDGTEFRQERTPEGLALFEQAAVDFLHTLRHWHPAAKLVWAYGMAGDILRPQLESAVDRFCRETGDKAAYYLPLPSATEETMGSRQHPGPQCHQEAAQITAEFLRKIGVI